MDLLENKISETKFNLSEPPKGHSKRFEQRLNGQFVSKRKIKLFIPAYAASIVILVSVIAILLTNNNKINDPELILSLEDQEFIESELFFQKQVNSKIATIENMDSNLNAVLLEINEFDESLKTLQKDLIETPGDERVVEAVLNTYMLKIEALDYILNIVKKQADKL